MPMYDYMCTICGRKTCDLRKAVERNELKPCENAECIGMQMKTISRGGGFRLKGTGWAADGYQTD